MEEVSKCHIYGECSYGSGLQHESHNNVQLHLSLGTLVFVGSGDTTSITERQSGGYYSVTFPYWRPSYTGMVETPWTYSFICIHSMYALSHGQASVENHIGRYTTDTATWLQTSVQTIICQHSTNQHRSTQSHPASTSLDPTSINPVPTSTDQPSPNQHQRT